MKRRRRKTLVLKSLFAQRARALEYVSPVLFFSLADENKISLSLVFAVEREKIYFSFSLVVVVLVLLSVRVCVFFFSASFSQRLCVRSLIADDMLSFHHPFTTTTSTRHDTTSTRERDQINHLHLQCLPRLDDADER